MSAAPAAVTPRARKRAPVAALPAPGSPGRPVRTKLNPLEISILQLAAVGVRDEIVRRRLNITSHTLNNRRDAIRRISRCKTREQIALWALRNGYLSAGGES